MGYREHNIVIVEDEGLIAIDLQRRLERAGYRVPAVAGTANEALEVIREKSPDLILMDIQLQGNADGIQVAEQVRRDFDIPVVYLTAYEDSRTLERASQTHAFGYIKKPIDSASLQGSIEIAISKHRHERLLREQRDWFSANFAAMPDAVLVADGARRITYVNPVAEQLLGCKVEDALGCSLYDALRIKYRNGEPVEDLVPVAMLQGAPVALPNDVYLEGGCGRRYEVEGTVAPRWREGGAEGVVVTFKDVTLRRFEERQARHDSKHDALARLADGVAGYLGLELSAVADESLRLLSSLPAYSKLRPSAQNIKTVAQDALEVTGRLRAFGQEREIKPQMVQVNEVLSKLEKIWLAALPGLTVRLDPNSRPAHADPRELTGVLEVLLQHARHWAASSGSIAMEASGAELEGLQEWVRIRVSYQTTGEDAERLERAFDPSWDGNWDGLPFTYGVAKRMGGLLRAHLEADKTVVFSVYLPSVEALAAGASPQGGEEPVLLVIERNSEVRRLLHAYFDQHGYRVLEAADCEQALLLAQGYERDIQVVIANPAADDPFRGELPARLLELNPEVSVRVIDGYREKEKSGWHYVTKRELLEWANQALGAMARFATAT